MKLVAKGLEIEVRAGTVEDVPRLLSFIRSMAEFENLEVTASEAILRESLFGKDPAAYTLLALDGDRPVAYAVYFFTFSTMLGKRGMWLEDVFVAPEYRGRGIAKAIMSYLANEAIRKECGRFEWMVLDWNRTAIDLYAKLGATTLDGWQVFRLDGDRLAKVAGQLARGDG